jgi:hypothetical protein
MSIHAKGHALKDVVSAIADTIGSRATTAEELIQAVIKRDRALVVTVDALDEASEVRHLRSPGCCDSSPSGQGERACAFWLAAAGVPAMSCSAC